MPKLYIPNYNLQNLIHKWKDLDKYYLKKTKSDMIYSDKGIFNIHNNKQLIRMCPIDIPIFTTEEGFTIDNSYFEETEIDSQIPYDHIRLCTECLHFCIGKQSGIHLVIEGTYDKDINIDTVTTQNLEDKYYQFYPCDMYFLSKEDINNKLFLEEVNMFLSIIR